MTVTRLTTRRVEKPWGRHTLWPGFDPVPEGAPPIGEIWFEAPEDDPELLIKYLFTDEKLSVQVHPDDRRAEQLGQPRGKSEAWLVLDAEPGASIGLGLKRPMSADALREAAVNGTIESDMDWPEVGAGDFFYLPAGVIHALGPGITVIEIQQNSDTTYRLYDYGRPRELHLEAGVEASDRGPYTPAPPEQKIAPGRTVMLRGPAFVLERWNGKIEGGLDTMGKPAWFIPVSGSVELSGQSIEPGGVWYADEPVDMTADQADLLVAYPGSDLAMVR